MGVSITDGVETASVDANNNLQVRTPTTESQAGFVQASSEVDAGAITTSRLVRAAEVTHDFRLRVGLETPIWDVSFEGTIIPQDRIIQASSVATIAQNSGYLTLNNNSSTATTNHCNVHSYRTLPIHNSYAVLLDMWASFQNESATFSVAEWGFGSCATTATPLDGAFFRINTNGLLYGVYNYNGNEVASDPISISDATNPITTNTFHHWLIILSQGRVEFWVNDVLRASVNTVTSRPATVSSWQQRVFSRVYILGGTASSARRLHIGRATVSMMDMAQSKPWGHVMAGSGGGAYQIQPGTASGGTCVRTAATDGWPASATAKTTSAWTATTAPATNSLGGRWLSPAISTLTSEADYPIFSYLNPAPTTTLPGKTLFITGIRVGETNVLTVAATNTIIILFAAGIGSTSSATTVAEGAAANAARIIPLGSASFTATAAPGTHVSGFYVDFSAAPLVVPAGMYAQFIIRPVGTVASNTLVLTGMVTFIGYFE